MTAEALENDGTVPLINRPCDSRQHRTVCRRSRFPEKSTCETDAERTKLTQPERDPTRTTGMPAEGNETTSYLLGDILSKHHAPALPRVRQGTFNASWCPPAGPCSVPTPSNEAHILRRESEIHRPANPEQRRRRRSASHLVKHEGNGVWGRTPDSYHRPRYREVP